MKGFYDPRTFSVQYVASCPRTRRCAIIDPVFDFDEKSGSTASRNADEILAYIDREGLTVDWILDTHPHADHFSAARYLKHKTQAPTCIGARVGDVQKLWKKIYNWPDLPTDGSQWDRLFADGETFTIGDIPVSVMFSPGHTLASVSYIVGDAAFVHDTLFMPDSGTARCDFPGGSARSMWRSIQRILSLPDDDTPVHRPRLSTRRSRATMGKHRRRAEAATTSTSPGRTKESYVALREARDRTMEMPRLILHALQINVRGGRLPDPEDNGATIFEDPAERAGGSALGMSLRDRRDVEERAPCRRSHEESLQSPSVVDRLLPRARRVVRQRTGGAARAPPAHAVAATRGTSRIRDRRHPPGRQADLLSAQGRSGRSIDRGSRTDLLRRRNAAGSPIKI